MSDTEFGNGKTQSGIESKPEEAAKEEIPLGTGKVPHTEKADVQAEIHRQLFHQAVDALTPEPERSPGHAASQSLESDVAELLSIIQAGDILDILQYMKTHDVSQIAEEYEKATGVSLEARIKDADPEFDDGCVRSFVKEELIESCAYLIHQNVHSGTLKANILEQLGDILSDPELQGIIQTYGVMFVANMNLDILNSLPEVDRFDVAPALVKMFGSEQEILQYLKKEIEREMMYADPVTRVINAASVQLQDAAKIIEERLRESMQPGWTGGSGVRSAVSGSIREASKKLKAHAEHKQKKEKMMRMFRIAAAAALGLALAVLGGANPVFKIAVPILCGYAAWVFSPSSPESRRRRAR